jgi:hypothetical protein
MSNKTEQTGWGGFIGFLLLAILIGIIIAKKGG